ncbi:O-antigen ligase family protein [Luminiphilus sp. nBUS_16]|uniref:O-antigen ligase family protein n=1 Tax=Luminiphilus sp. nBUS_16 TaxID=3395315 RepID=UPI003EBD6099
MITRLLKCSLALFAISPLVNVGPVNVTALLLLLTSALQLSTQPQQFFVFWRQYWGFMLTMVALTSAFLLSNLLNNNVNILDATFAQGRWFLLLAVASPAVVCNLNTRDWRELSYFSASIALLFTAVYLVDAFTYLTLGSNFVLDLIDAKRGDPIRPSWVFNPHPFSRTLLAAMLLLLGCALADNSRLARALCCIGILGLGALLILGAVRTAFIAVAVLACLGVFLYRGKALLRSLSAGLLLSAVGLWFRGQLFPMDQTDKSLGLREALFEQGVDAFLATPWFGGGYQASRAISWPPELAKFASAQTMETTNTHLQWLEMLVSYGLLGGLLFTALWLLSGWLILKASNRYSSTQKLAAVLLFLNWTSLTIASFTTVYRESEWALWVVTLLASLSLLERQSIASGQPHTASKPAH